MSIVIIGEGIASLLQKVAQLDNSPAKTNLINSLNAANSHIELLKAQAAATTPLTDFQSMMVVLNQHITQEHGKKVLFGQTYAGDIPPHILYAAYQKITHSDITQMQPIAAVEVKKPLPAVADSSDTAKQDKEEVLQLAETTEADMQRKIELAAQYLQKVKSPEQLNKAYAHSTITLFYIARAANLILESEIDPTTPTGYTDDLTRQDVCERLFEHLQSDGNDD